MARFRKRLVVIEAVRYEGHGNFEEHDVPDWVWDAFEKGVLQPTGGSDPLYVKTIEGSMWLGVGDYLIQGVNGELYPCKAEIFAKTYEPVEGEDAER